MYRQNIFTVLLYIEIKEHFFSHTVYLNNKFKINKEINNICTGIQVLRENNFNPETMIRRAPSSEVVGVGVGVDSEAADGGGGTPDLARWSSHRVMQWLKEIDLAEYAPNLRGAGEYCATNDTNEDPVNNM